MWLSKSDMEGHIGFPLTASQFLNIVKDLSDGYDYEFLVTEWRKKLENCPASPELDKVDWQAELNFMLKEEKC